MVHVFYFHFLRYLAVPLFHFKLATTMCGSPPCPCIYLFRSITVSCSVVFHRQKGGGRAATRQPGVVHILRLLGVVHTFINGNLCLPNILCLNISQSDSNSLKNIIRLHCLRLYIYQIFGPVETYSYEFCWQYILTLCTYHKLYYCKSPSTISFPTQLIILFTCTHSQNKCIIVSSAICIPTTPSLSYYV